MAIPSRPPTAEIGSEQPYGLQIDIGGRLQPWAMFIDDRERVPELTWPSSVSVYDRMRTDTQIEGLFAGLIWPILRYHWMIDPNGADEAIVDGIADDLGLDVKDEQPKPRRRQRDRFSFIEHQKDAFLALLFGHYFFEQVGVIGDDGLWHLKKLAPREPRTIFQINVANDGGLVSIKQFFANAVNTDIPEIPVDRLVAYSWQKEGAHWVGRSMLRSCYRNFVLKDRLLRIDAINHERAGGVPIVESAPGATPTEINENAQLAQAFRITESGGGALPSGSKLSVVRGTQSDVVASIRYHDEQMARRFLMMLMQLGQTVTGSRALGATFLDFFQLGQEGIADWFMETFNSHVIEDWVDWNYGPQTEHVPKLIWERTNDNQAITIEQLVALINSGGLVMDRELEDMIRDQWNLTKKMKGAPDPRPPVTVQPDPTLAPDPAPTPNDPPTPVKAMARSGERGETVESDSLLVGDPRSPTLFDQEVM